MVSSQTIIQSLVTGTQHDSKLEVTNLNNAKQSLIANEGEHLGQNVIQVSPITDKGNIQFTAIYTNLKDWSYQGKPITKLKYDIRLKANYLSGYENASDKYGFNIQLSQDPTKGFNLNGYSMEYDITMFYADGTPVNFGEGDAYITAGSLNNYTNMTGWQKGDLGAVDITDPNAPGSYKAEWHGYSIETATPLSGGKALTLVGSTVSNHGGTLYANEPNTYKTILGGNVDGSWDENGSGKQYLGAGLIRLSGEKTTLRFNTISDGIKPGYVYRNYMWGNLTAVIPETPATNINYHYNVAQVKSVYSTTERRTRGTANTLKCRNLDKKVRKCLVKNEADYGHKPLILW